MLEEDIFYCGDSDSDWDAEDVVPLFLLVTLFVKNKQKLPKLMIFSRKLPLRKAK